MDNLNNICQNSNILTVFLILKYTLSIVCTVIPIIVIYSAISPAFKGVLKPDEVKKMIGPIIRSLIAGLIIFFLPSLFSFIFTDLVGQKDQMISNCFANASIENINRLREKEAQERKEAQEEDNKKSAEELKKQKEEQAKKNVNLKKLREEKERQNTQASASSGGSGIWKDSIFPLPSGATTCRSSVFGPRTHPITGEYNNHSGDDYPAACGTSVSAVLDGKVIEAANDGGYHGGMGNYVKIQHNDGTYSVYMHSSNVLVRAGQTVRKGQEIMKVGTTGSSTGCHLHITIKNSSGVNVEPRLYIPTLAAC